MWRIWMAENRSLHYNMDNLDISQSQNMIISWKGQSIRIHSRFHGRFSWVTLCNDVTLTQASPDWAPIVRTMWRNLVAQMFCACHLEPSSSWLKDKTSFLATMSQVHESNCRGTKLGGDNTDTNSPTDPGDHSDPPTIKTQPHPGPTLPQGPRHPPLLQLRRDADQVPRLQHGRQSQDGRGRVWCSFSWDLCHRCDGRRD